MSGMTEDDWNAIVDALLDGDCVPFLGAGASLGFGVPSLPTGGELAEELASVCDYQGAERQDFLRVCQYYELRRGGQKLRQQIVRRLSVENIQPSAVHRAIASFGLTHVLTTNYDRLMERAYEDKGKSPQVTVHNNFSPENVRMKQGTVSSPIVYKLHGTLTDPLSMVCTENDVIDFLVRLIYKEPGLPESIQVLFETRPILFIGYGLRDWNIRVLMRAMRLNGAGRRRDPTDWTKSFAVQRKPSDPRQAFDWDHTVWYLDRKDNIKCFDEDAHQFVAELEKRYGVRGGRRTS